MTSDTWPSSGLTNDYISDPVHVAIEDLNLSAMHNVEQHFVMSPENEDKKPGMLIDMLLQLGHTDKALVFCTHKDICSHLSSELALKGIRCNMFSCELDQSDREIALSEFSQGIVMILIASDLACRGLDIQDISHIFNYNLPYHIEDYVHRIGRTGRAGKKGTSISFLSPDDWKIAPKLIEILEEADQEVPDELEEIINRQGSSKPAHEDDGSHRDRVQTSVIFKDSSFPSLPSSSHSVGRKFAFRNGSSQARASTDGRGRAIGAGGGKRANNDVPDSRQAAGSGVNGRGRGGAGGRDHVGVRDDRRGCSQRNCSRGGGFRSRGRD